MRIVFMGTPDFAVPSLQALIDGPWELAAAITQPDRPVGRGGKLAQSPVKQMAVRAGIPVFQPARIKSDEGAALLESLRPDLCVTAAFGQILSARNLATPKAGTVNVHASLLPRHRGSAPIQRAIEMGDAVTGITTMLTDVGLDTGAILLKAQTPIGADETAAQLSDRLAVLGAQTLTKTLEALQAGTLRPVAQDEALATYEPMLTREDGRLDFSLRAEAVARKVRAYDPWPGTWTEIAQGRLKILRARAVALSHGAKAGEILVSSPREGLLVACGQDALEIVELQAPGAKRMEAKAYLRGKSLPVGMSLQPEA